MNPERVKQLMRLAEYRLTRDMAELATVNARLRGLENAREEVRKVAEAELPRTGACDPSDLAAYSRWTAWAGQERTRINKAAHQMQSEEWTSARNALGKSFGQSRLLSDLHEKTMREESARRRSLAERENRPPED